MSDVMISENCSVEAKKPCCQTLKENDKAVLLFYHLKS